ncbi:phosphoadenosine phosphosulfate reductase family protein [Candidatus Pacearchaeota archaeon]|nr:phosphoadenosine phosphosulfate reductase family protein [Candidatus Pacearchaeota archaeon]
MKHICLFSGGAGSAYMSYLVSQKQRYEDVILLFQDTKSEHPDAYRFRKQVSEYIGISITEVSDGRDLWELIDDNHCLPSNMIPFCSRILKQEQAEKYYKTLEDDFVLYIGYGPDEWKRIQRQTARIEHAGRTVKYPLAEIGNTVLKDKSLTECAGEWQNELDNNLDLFTEEELDDNIPCMCAL